MSKRKPTPNNPYFTAEDYQALRQARHALANLIGECDRAHACGIDVSDLRSARDEVDRQLAAIEAHYMNGQPAS